MLAHKNARISRLIAKLCQVDAKEDKVEPLGCCHEFSDQRASSFGSDVEIVRVNIESYELLDSATLRGNRCSSNPNERVEHYANSVLAVESDAIFDQFRRK